MKDFFIAYRKTLLQSSEFIESIEIPFTKENEFVRAYKQSKRRDDDIAIVNACFKMTLHSDSSVESCSFVFGGVGAFTVAASKAMQKATGMKVNHEFLEMILSQLSQVPLCP